MPSQSEELLTDPEAATEQITDLIARIDLELQRREELGIVLREPDDTPEPDDFDDPGTISYE